MVLDTCKTIANGLHELFKGGIAAQMDDQPCRHGIRENNMKARCGGCITPFEVFDLTVFVGLAPATLPHLHSFDSPKT